MRPADPPDFKPLALAVLQQAEPFAGCSRAALQALISTGHTEWLPAGAFAQRRGQAVHSLVLVLSGVLVASTTSAAGKRLVAQFLGPGQVSGLIPFLDGGAAIHDNQAHGPTLVLRIRQQDLQQAIESEPRLASGLLRLLAVRGRALHQAATTLTLESLQVRVARALWSLVAASGRPQGDAAAVDLKLSQEELANMMGLTRQRVNRELNAFAAMGLISTAYAQIRVLDLAGLARLAD